MKGFKPIGEPIKSVAIEMAETRKRVAETINRRKERVAELEQSLPTDRQTNCPACHYDKAFQRYRVDKKRIEIISCIFCERCKAAQDQRAVQRLRDDFDIPPEFQSASIKGFNAVFDYQKTAVEAAQHFLSHWSKNWLAFVGKPGTGKTHLAYAIANALAENPVNQGVRPKRILRHTKYVRLIRNIRSCYDSHETTEEQVIQSYDYPQLLIIDEIGLQDKLSSWERATIDDLLDYRYEHHKGLIITSNLSVEQLFEFLGERVRSRFAARGRILSFTWDDYRKSRRKEKQDGQEKEGP